MMHAEAYFITALQKFSWYYVNTPGITSTRSMARTRELVSSCINEEKAMSVLPPVDAFISHGLILWLARIIIIVKVILLLFQ